MSPNNFNNIKKLLRPSYHFIKEKLRVRHIRKETARLNHIAPSDLSRIFYFGITEHSNLGDMAQYYCIEKWIQEQFQNCPYYEFEATTIVENREEFLGKLSRVLTEKDIIVFQSGYTTQDLGGCHEEMHRIVINAFPKTKILMMPQTVFFREKANQVRTSKSYDRAENLLFLARDRISYQTALKMFPHVTVALYPDIVTTMIGHCFSFPRRGILFCCRDDAEKYYADEQIEKLIERLRQIAPVDRTDTTIRACYIKIRKHLRKYVEGEIERFAHYRLIITDRYHGTIFSLAANTPVIVLKTNDHKVVTGVEWFSGIYDSYIHQADSMEQAYEKSILILSEQYDYQLPPHFDAEYGQKLRSLMSLAFHENGESVDEYDL